MKILFVSSSSGSHGGGELCLLYLADALRQRGHEVALWCSTHNRMDALCAKFTPIGAVHRLPYPNTYYDRPSRSLGACLDRGTPRLVAEHWRSLEPDIIHINKQNLEDGLDLVAAADLAAIPSMCMIHITQPAQWLGASFGWLRDKVASLALRRFDKPLVTTPETRADSLREIVGSSADIRIIHNGVPSPEPGIDARRANRKQIGVPDEAPLFIEVARMEEQKNPFKFIELASDAIRSGSPAHFLWVGSGSLEQSWLQAAADHSLRGRVHHVPWTDDPGAWLAAADAFLHTANFEGMPFAVLEALAAGLPVLLQQSLIDEIPPFHAEGILAIDKDRRWLSSIETPQSRSVVAKAAQQLFEAEFSIEKMAQQYEALYAEVVNKNG